MCFIFIIIMSLLRKSWALFLHTKKPIEVQIGNHSGLKNNVYIKFYEQNLFCINLDEVVKKNNYICASNGNLICWQKDYSREIKLDLYNFHGNITTKDCFFRGQVCSQSGGHRFDFGDIRGYQQFCVNGVFTLKPNEEYDFIIAQTNNNGYCFTEFDTRMYIDSTCYRRSSIFKLKVNSNDNKSYTWLQMLQNKI